MAISDWINSILAFATVLMAGGTVYLGRVTHYLAKEATKATNQAERHHRENLHEEQERERVARQKLWESIAILSRNCLEAIDNLLQNYPSPPTSDILGDFLRSHTQSDFDVPMDGLAAVSLHEVGDASLITAVLTLRGVMGRITSHLDEVRSSKGVTRLSIEMVRSQRTPAFNAVASILRIVEGTGVAPEVSRLAVRA